ncbi:MAG: hypothetical protein D3903_01425 [Candidatus Electrothrix sp. GM3_4]|nr:hypothetical protein [Candidatus Electrothrix sp. GM3_4]
MSKKKITVALTFMLFFSVLAEGYGGNKKIMSMGAAKVLAERAIVESIYGLKIRSTEEVVDMVAASFIGKTESKTSADIRGIKITNIGYNSKSDIAQATAEATINSLINIDGQKVNLMGKTFTRTAFATSTPANAGRIRALRAAEIDAYKQLAKAILGFTLESKTTVENYLLTSDIVKTKVLATVYLAEIEKFYWDGEGDAYVEMFIKKSEIEGMLGVSIPDIAELIEVVGQGAQHDDFKSGR